MRFRPPLLVSLAGVAVLSVLVLLPRPLERPFTFQGHTGTIFAVAFAPDGKHVVSGSKDETIKVWDMIGLLQRATSDITGAIRRAVR